MNIIEQVDYSIFIGLCIIGLIYSLSYIYEILKDWKLKEIKIKSKEKND